MRNSPGEICDDKIDDTDVICSNVSCEPLLSKQPKDVVESAESSTGGSVVETWPPVSQLDVKWHLDLHARVFSSGVPNYVGVRIPVMSGLNIPAFRSLLLAYKDKTLCDFLEFGWPVGQFHTSPAECSRPKNHAGARQFQGHVDKYIVKEVALGATLGPFNVSPFTHSFVTSPLNTVPKSDGQDRRVIMDLSYPPEGSVNAAIPKKTYLGEDITLQYPSVDNLANFMRVAGPGCSMFKRDLSRAYRQLPVDPGDWHLLGFHWRDQLYFDKVLPFGLRSAAFICQSVTNSVVYLMEQKGYRLCAYLDVRPMIKPSKPLSVLVIYFRTLDYRKHLKRHAGHLMS